MGQRTQEFILVRPLVVKVKAQSSMRWYCLCLDYQGAIPLDLAFDLLFLALNRRRVVPLYTQIDAQRLTESRPAHRQRVRLGDYLFMPYNTSLTHKAVYFYGP